MMIKAIKRFDLKIIKYSWLWELILVACLSFGLFEIFSLIFKGVVFDNARDVGIIIGVIIAGVISLIVSFNNKENEINKYRMKWCEDIRELAHDYMAEISSMQSTISIRDRKFKTKHSKLRYYYDNYVNNIGTESIRRIERSGYKVDLMLKNRGDVKEEGSVHALFESLNDRFLRVIVLITFYGEKSKNGEDVTDFDEKVNDISEILDGLKKNYIDPLGDKVSDYLGDEWNKIKYGGFWFRCKKCLMFSIIISLCVFFLRRVVLEGAP